MKEIKQHSTNHEIETLIVAGKNLVEYIKEYPNTLESSISHLQQDDKNELLLHFSIQGDIKCIKYLVEQGVDIHTKDNLALHLSAYNGHLDIVKYLVEQGADIRAKYNYALRLSAENGHLDVVKYMVEQGADIHAQNDLALRWSAEEGHLDVVKYLIEQGANIHAQDDEALCLSAEKGHLEVVKYLVEQGADIHAQDYALRIAKRNSNLDVVNYLEGIINERNKTNTYQS